MRKVLILTYYWPPSGGPGVQRWLKFVKYLPEFGWQPTVITPQHGTYPALDESLESDIPTTVKVLKTATLEPFAIYNWLRGERGKVLKPETVALDQNKGFIHQLSTFIRGNFFIPDARRGWNFFARRAARKELRSSIYDAIITSGPPQSTHLIGRTLQQEFGIRWIADLRDPWTNVYYNQSLKRREWAHHWDYELESSVIKHADHLITVSDGVADDFRDRARAIAILPNGFDHTEITTVDADITPQFTLTYMGNFKQNQHFDAFWNGLSAVIQRHSDWKSMLKVRFVGDVDATIQATLQRTGLEAQVEFTGYVSHETALKYLRASNLLLLFIPRSSGNKGILTGKLFEYLATGIPLLSMGPRDGDAAHLLSECDRSAMLDFDDEQGVATQIEHSISTWLANNKQRTVHPQNERVEAFSRKALTSTLASILAG